MSEKMELTKEEKSLCNKLWFSFNFIRLLGNKINNNGCGFLFSMTPALRKFYQGDDEGLKDACKRHIEVFNTHSVFCHLLGGVAAGMEKEKIAGKCDAEAISMVKLSLMGPLAGIGDSFFYTCYRVIIAGIAMGFCAQGSMIGPLLFFLLYGGGQIVLKWFLIRVGYKTGSAMVEKAFSTGILPILTKVFGFIGMAMLGTMIATTVKVSIAAKPVINDAPVEFQKMFDQILPGILSLVLFFIVFRLLKKRISPLWIVFGTMAVCIVLSIMGIV